MRLINWCIDKDNDRLSEKWLVRLENGGSYREMICEVHRVLLNKCFSPSEAINAVSLSHNRPIPYHPIGIEIGVEDGRIYAYTPKHNDWEDLADITSLVNIAGEIKLLTVIVTKQEQPTGESMNNARSAVINNPVFCCKRTAKKSHDVAAMLTFLTQVKPTELVVTEQHGGPLGTRTLSAKETLDFLKAHASHAYKERATLTVYKLHMNKRFAHAAMQVITSEILTEKQRTIVQPWWSEEGYVFMPNPFFRVVFFTDPNHVEACPLERLFLEQYFTVPCESGGYNASCSKNVTHIFSRMVPSISDNQTAMKKGGLENSEEFQATMSNREEARVTPTIPGICKIAVFDYKMFYPYVLCVLAGSLAYRSRVSHMAAARILVPALKSVYTKELGMLALVRQPLHGNMLALAETILGSLVKACQHLGIQVLLTQTDSVTVRVSSTVIQACGGSMEHLGLVLQQKVRVQHPTFLSELKLERQGTNMIMYGPNKHILYDGEQVVHRTGFHAKTFCPAMSCTILDATDNMSRAKLLLCTSDQNTPLTMFVSKKMKEYTHGRKDLLCDSYGLPLPLLIHALHVQPGDNGMLSNMPHLYLALSQYRADNEQTMPTLRYFTNSLNAGTITPLKNKHLDPELAKRAVESIFTEKMGMIRWSLVLEGLIEHFVMKSVSFLIGGRFV